MSNYSITFSKEVTTFYIIIRYIANFETIKNYNGGNIICENIKNTENLDEKNQVLINEEQINEIELKKTPEKDECMNHEIVKEEQINEENKYKYTLALKAPYGTYELNYNDNIINVEYRIYDTIVGTEKSATKYENIKLSAKNKEILLDFVESARKYCDVPINKQHNKNISIKQYDVKYNRWVQLSQLKKRDLNSVFLDKIENIKNDIDKFIKSEKDYERYGIPYKRNYLLYGLPGTGKTSLIFALASYLNMSVSIFSFVPGIDDTIFMKCVNSLPNNSILLLEDIDGVFTYRMKDYNNNSMISFSGVLNTLDGMGRKDKLITFMTTNLKDNLDQALLRPGRVDYKLEFTYTTQNQISNMYDLFIKNKKYKKEFMNYVKTKKITTCVLQKFLFEYREEENIMKKIDIFDMYVESYQIAGKNLYT